MNAPPKDSGRRRFLTRLFQADQPATTSLVPLPVVRGQGKSVFWALAGNTSDDVYLAGDDGVLFHFDGEQWNREHSGSDHNIHALCLNDGQVYSVGWLGQICRRDSGQWAPVQGGGKDTARVNWPLFDINATQDGDPWAVGDQGRVTRLLDGQWQEQDSGSNANLRCVLAVDDGRVLVGGLGGTFLEWSDGNWTQLETGTGSAIVSIAQLGADSFVAVGGEYSVADGEFVGRIFIYSEGVFSEVDTAERLPRLRKVRPAGDGLLIVGDGGAAYRWAAQGVTSIPGRARYDLHDALAIDGGEVLICGDGETLLSEQVQSEGEDFSEQPGCAWEPVAEGATQRTLRALLAVDSQHIIAAGDGGEILHLRSGELEKQQLPGGLTVHALWASSPRNVFAACDAATIAHFDGEQWSVIHKGEQDVPFLAITGFGPHDIFAVGDAGLAVRYDGLMWRQLESGTRQELYGLWGQDSDHLLAVGGGGLVLRFDGERWKSFTAGTEQDLYAVHGKGLQKLYLAGLAGTLIRFENNGWHREFSGVRSDLHALASDGSGQIFCCGSNGTLLRQDGEHWQLEESGVTNTLQTLLCVGGDCYAAGSGGTLLRRISGS